MPAQANFPFPHFPCSLSFALSPFLLANWHLKFDLSAVIKNKTFIYEFLWHATKSGRLAYCLRFSSFRVFPCLSPPLLISSIFHTRKRVVCLPVLIDVRRVSLSEQLNKLIEEFASLSALLLVYFGRGYDTPFGLLIADIHLSFALGSE